MQLVTIPAVGIGAVCDEVVRELLAHCSVLAPPVDAFAVADQLDLPVMFDEHQTGRARLKRIGGRGAIFIRPDERPERMQWAVAHEIGSLLPGRSANGSESTCC